MGLFTPDVQFREDGPLYGLVLGYLCQMHGLIEIASRGIRNKLDTLGPDGAAEVLEHSNALSDADYAAAMRRIAAGGKTALLSELNLASRIDDSVRVDVDGLAEEILRSHLPAVKAMNPLASGALLIVSWEAVKDVLPPSPTREFLRHCRNAAAHRGRFTFSDREPARPATWRGMVINQALQGTLLFTDGKTDGFLGPADILYLLADVDATLPEADA